MPHFIFVNNLSISCFCLADNVKIFLQNNLPGSFARIKTKSAPIPSLPSKLRPNPHPQNTHTHTHLFSQLYYLLCLLFPTPTKNFFPSPHPHLPPPPPPPPSTTSPCYPSRYHHLNHLLAIPAQPLSLTWTTRCCWNRWDRSGRPQSTHSTSQRTTDVAGPCQTAARAEHVPPPTCAQGWSHSAGRHHHHHHHRRCHQIWPSCLAGRGGDGSWRWGTGSARSARCCLMIGPVSRWNCGCQNQRSLVRVMAERIWLYINLTCTAWFLILNIMSFISLTCLVSKSLSQRIVNAVSTNDLT